MKKYFVILFFIILIIVFVFVFAQNTRVEKDVNIVTVTKEPILNKIKKITELVLYPTQSRYTGMFDRVTLITENPLAELTELVRDSKINAVLKINRIDRNNLRTGMTIIVPKDVNILKWQYMPNKISAAKTLSKLVIISQPIQAFGVYEKGVLVRSGPVSSGKKLTQTESGLFFVNWKGEEVVSTFDDEWILKWNMNIDNLGGISMHQYSLPGFPASHSCVRMTEDDAYWLYNWVDQWTWENGDVVAEGTPVVVYGNYNFDGPPPWTLLPENSKSTDTPRLILEDLVKGYLPKIKSRISK